MKIKILGTAAVLAMLAVSAAPSQAGGLGCLIGAGAGGFGGSMIGKGTGKTIATIAGTLIGCGVASSIQDNDNRRYQQQRPVYQTQPTYSRYSSQPRYEQPRFETYDWRNSPRLRATSYRTYEVLPGRQQIAQAPAANSCASGYTREYTTTVMVSGRQVPAYGTACYKPDGSWELGTATPVR